MNVDFLLRNTHRKGHELAQFLEGRRGVTQGHREEIDDWVDEAVALLAAYLPDDASQQFMAAGQNEAGPVRRLRFRVKALQQIIDERQVDEGLNPRAGVPLRECREAAICNLGVARRSRAPTSSLSAQRVRHQFTERHTGSGASVET